MKSASGKNLLLDYDGTIAPFHIDPERAFPYPQIPELLAQIITNGTRVVIVSGRPATTLVKLCGLEPHPEIWGSHGLERLHPNGDYQIAKLTAKQNDGLEKAKQAVDIQSLRGRTEIKPGGLAVHWRGMTGMEVQSIQEMVAARWTPLAQRYDLKILHFDGGIEITSLSTKGDAVQAILNESPMDAATAYLGDDQTDEDAFRALKGKGLSILVRPQFRNTEADLWLKPPEELVTFLEKWRDVSGGSGC